MLHFVVVLFEQLKLFGFVDGQERRVGDDLRVVRSVGVAEQTFDFGFLLSFEFDERAPIFGAAAIPWGKATLPIIRRRQQQCFLAVGVAFVGFGANQAPDECVGKPERFLPGGRGGVTGC